MFGKCYRKLTQDFLNITVNLGFDKQSFTWNYDFVQKAAVILPNLKLNSTKIQDSLQKNLNSTLLKRFEKSRQRYV